ncbi:MAG: bifunctional nuclease family protein, partial [Deltaproteobacteria bacterium]|nr:bifunctional nuclease family protein [Deltaproteobacteria bacterium]
ESARVTVERVGIINLADITFYAAVDFAHGDRRWAMDARPSDAIAIALRTKAPIFVSKKVIDKSRKIDLSKDVADDDQTRKQKWAEILENLSPEDFGKYKM